VPPGTTIIWRAGVMFHDWQRRAQEVKDTNAGAGAGAGAGKYRPSAFSARVSAAPPSSHRFAGQPV